MTDDAYTDPTAIRALYSSRGKNAKLNVAKAESLGVAASNVSPTRQESPTSGGTGGTGIMVSSDNIPDPTLYNEPAREFIDDEFGVL